MDLKTIKIWGAIRDGDTSKGYSSQEEPGWERLDKAQQLEVRPTCSQEDHHGRDAPSWKLRKTVQQERGLNREKPGEELIKIDSEERVVRWR